MREAVFQRKVYNFLVSQGARQARFSTIGWPDYMAIIHGQPLFVEVKKSEADSIAKGDQLTVRIFLQNQGFAYTIIHPDMEWKMSLLYQIEKIEEFKDRVKDCKV